MADKVRVSDLDFVYISLPGAKQGTELGRPQEQGAMGQTGGRCSGL